jgi:protein PhnA
MSKRHDKHLKRANDLSMLGKDLARRSHSKCELCAAMGVSLAPYEVSPVPADPDSDKTLFICEVCTTQVEHPKQMNANHWHCLSAAVWSAVPVVQVMAVRILERLKDKEGWAEDLYDQLYLEPDIREWIDHT